MQLVCQDKTRCKMILNEFVDKTKMECGYETVQVEKYSHVFVSSLVLNGTCYKGECGKNKKEAEQLAALSSILSLLDDPIYATQISEVIKSKFSACDVFNVLKDCSVTSNEFKATTSNGRGVIMPLAQQSSFRVLVDDPKRTTTSVEQVLVNSLPQIENQVKKTSLPQTEKLAGDGVLLDDTQCVANHLPGAVTISRCSYVPLPRTSPLVLEPQHEIKSPEATQLPFNQIGVPREVVPVPAAAHNPCKDLISFKQRRRKNKRKTNKRLPRTPPLFWEPQHEIKLLQQIGVRTEFVPVPAAAQNPGNGPISSKKRRRKNKQKANKRRRLIS